MLRTCHNPSTTVRRGVLASSLLRQLQGLISLSLVLSVCGGVAHSADSTLRPPNGPAGPAIVIGFVGGFVHRNDLRHSEVQLAQKLNSQYRDRAHIEIFENRHRDDAYAAIRNWLGLNRDGVDSPIRRGQPRIILYGHSWGASAVVALARQLEHDQIPVLLTIQVDSISKPGSDNHMIPANVIRAVNFYQTGGPLHGDRQIVAADPAHTQILGDFRFKYTKEPEPCAAYPWFSRHFMKGHISIECDPDVWSRIERLITESLFPSADPTTVSSNF